MTLHSLKRPLVLAALLAAPVLAWSAPVCAAPGDKPAPAAADVSKATAFFVKGTELFKAKKYAPALEQFKQSYGLVPSPNSHLYIARCLAGLDQARAAWLEFDRTAAEATAGGAKYVPTHDSAVQERDDLAPKLTLVVVTVPNADANTAVRVGGYDIPADHLGRPYPVDAGTFDVIVQGPGRAPTTQSVTVRVGERREVSVALGAAGGPMLPGGAQPPPGDASGTSKRRISPMRIGAFVAGGVGVVGFVMFGVEGAASKSTFNTLSAQCGGKAGCPGQTGANRAAADSLISSGKTQQAVANAGLTIGAIGIAAGVTLFALSLRKAPSDGAQPTADLVVGPSWAGARGTF